jgi:hypothetical protein
MFSRCGPQYAPGDHSGRSPAAWSPVWIRASGPTTLPERLGPWPQTSQGQDRHGAAQYRSPVSSTGWSAASPTAPQGWPEEFGSHIGRSYPLPREPPFHKIVDWDATAARFAYDLAYADRQPDWTSPS